MARTKATPSDDTFDRFPKETLAFLRVLAASNTRAWFAEHKTDCERALKVPAVQFSAILTSNLERLTGRRHTHKIYRIHRDGRFAKDKTLTTPISTFRLHRKLSAALHPSGCSASIRPG